MDPIDRNIAIALQQDGSAGLAELAKIAGLSVSATAERVKRLEERGVISGWHATLDPAAAGCPLLLHLLVTLSPGADRTAFAAAVQAQEAVLECHAVSGGHDYLLKLRLPDLAAVEPFLAELRALAGLQRVESLVALSTLKETAILPVAPADEE